MAQTQEATFTEITLACQGPSQHKNAAVQDWRLPWLEAVAEARRRRAGKPVGVTRVHGGPSEEMIQEAVKMFRQRDGCLRMIAAAIADQNTEMVAQYRAQLEFIEYQLS